MRWSDVRQSYPNQWLVIEFSADGILGMNFLMPFGAVIDLNVLTIEVI